MAARTITTLDDLKALYGEISAPALAKERTALTPHYRAFVEAAPFMVIATIGPKGLDTSPRGDPAGFVHVVDDKTLLIPDRRGNNRLDTLKNILHDPRISLIFLIPGVGEALRVRGRAEIIQDDELAAGFVMQGKAPTTLLRITIECVYFQCQKAIARSRLWDPASVIDRTTLPTAGEMVEALVSEPFDGKAYDADYPERLKRTIY
ncbi:MAG: pyridoxamine 5'-phosphate oxidase family protein [Parvibaculum sp.]